MFNIFESGSRRAIIATAPTLDDAKAKIVAMGVAFMEDDADHPGCVDAYMNDMRVLVIEPEGFTVKSDAQHAAMKKMATERADAFAAFDAEFLK